MPDGPPSDGIEERLQRAVFDDEELRSLSACRGVSPESLRQAIRFVGTNPEDVGRYLRWANAVDEELSSARASGAPPND
jgi:hypothetical protein